jgi:hypothetical protein
VLNTTFKTIFHLFILAISFIGGGNPITVENHWLVASHRQRLLQLGLVYGA